MPRLPNLLSQAQVPRQTGVPRGTVRTPATEQPFASQQVGAALGRSVAGLGQDVERAGLIEGDIQAVQARVQRAQDVLDAKQASQEFELQFQQTFAELAESGDFRTLPEQTVQGGRELVAQMREGMTPGAAQRFEAEALEFMRVVQAKALNLRTERRNEQRQFVLQQGITQHTRGIVEAGDEAERAYHQDALAGLLQDAVTHGLLGGEAAAQAYQASRDTAAVEHVRRQMRLDPGGVEQALVEEAEGGLDLIGNVPIANLIDEARTLRRQALKDELTLESRQEQLLDKAQNQRAGALRSRLFALDPVPEHVGQFRAMLEEANAMFASGQLNEADHGQIGGMLRSYINKAVTAPTVRDDPQVLKDRTIGVLFADTPEQARQERFNLMEAADDLQPSTLTSLFRTLEQREEGTHYSNRDTYRQGREIISRAAFPEARGGGFGLDMAMLFNPSSEIRTQLSGALDAFDERMEQASQQGFRAVDRAAIPTAREIRAEFFPEREQALQGQGQSAGDQTQLPPQLDPGLQGPRTEKEAMQKIAELAASDPALQSPEAQQRLFETWQEQLRQQVEMERTLGATQ